MELSDLKQLISRAIDECQSIIEGNPNVVLSEADFERLLANCISEAINKETKNQQEDVFSVHTQISHYVDGKVHPDVRPDILLLIERMLQSSIDNYIPHKKEKYDGPSIAIELKYLHIGDSTSIVEKDFEKWKKKLDDKTWLYVVVLLDTPRHPRKKGYFEDKEAKILILCNAMKEEHRDYNNKVECKVLKKIKG